MHIRFTVIAALFLTGSCSRVEEPASQADYIDPPYVAMHNVDELRRARAPLIPYPRQARWGEGFYTGSDIRELLVPLTFSDNPEAYALEITKDGIEIRANSEKGLVYARTTLRQLGKDGEQEYPLVSIQDYPAYAVRGVMHDVGRNFQTVDYLKEQLLKLSAYKINTFQWHLSDNPGWRIESIKYPELNDPENYRQTRDPGMFYSYAEIVEFMQFARKLNIQVIPELDMPGHSKFFKNTFGFSMGSYRGRKICAELLQEFFDHVPAELAPLIHLGSDEVFILFPDHFVRKMEAKVRENGRTAIVWKPGLSSADDTVVQVWSSAAFDPTRSNIDSTDFYTNGMDPVNSFQRVYFKQIVGRPTGDPDFALGGIIATWNDVNVNKQEHVLRNNPFYLTALTGAEVMWNGNPTGSRRYQALIPPKGSLEHTMLAEFEQRLLFHKNKHFTESEFFYIPQLDAQWLVTANNGATKLAIGNTIILRRRHTGEGLFGDLPVGSQVTATHTVHSDVAREVLLHAGIGSPYRSHRKWQGIPELGEWDAFGATITLNGKPVEPPRWREPGRFKHLESAWHKPIQEEPWREEELYWLRQPVEVRLEKGDNTIAITTRYAYAEQHWQFSLWLSEQPTQ